MGCFPLLKDAAGYRPCIQDLLHDTAAREYWLGVFESHVDTLADLPVHSARLDEHPAWPAFRQDYLAGLEEFRREPARRGRLTVLDLTLYRDEKLAAHGFDDPFAALKQRENEAAVRLLPAMLRDLDAVPQPLRMRKVVAGLFAGNLFDMGSRAAVDQFEHAGFSFAAARERILSRRWPIDDLPKWLECWRAPSPDSQVLFFVDNAGADIVLGALPWARELARCGARVVLAANSRPALNDITAAELRAILPRVAAADTLLEDLLSAGRIAVVESGCRSPLIDLTQLSEVCCAEAARSDLLILEGMGRAVESNWDARFTIDTVKVALIKDGMVADLLGVELLDPVFRFEPRASPDEVDLSRIRDEAGPMRPR